MGRDRRRRRSSVSVAGVELLLERLASRLHVSPLPVKVRDEFAEAFLAWCAERAHVAKEAEARRVEQLRAENDELRRENARLRDLMRTA